MIGKLAFRSLTAHPVRSAVLAGGFGLGVAVTAILLGVAEVVLQQAQAPALAGGGDVVVRLGPQVPAQLLLSGTLQSDALRPRVRVAAPFHTSALYLVRDGRTTRVEARGGIPGLEALLGDVETSGVAGWTDSPDDVAWTRDSPESVLRHIDRFHPIPDAPEWADSWAEWLYFNGRASGARFYLTFLVGARLENGKRAAGVRLQLDRGGQMETFGASAELTDEEVMRAPDLAIGGSSVRLDGLRYRIGLNLSGERGARLTGDLTLEASPGRLVPPLEISGARGWRTGYVVPVTSGTLTGELKVGDERIPLEGTGYHDHNWGFWEGVSWQWGQVQHEDLSFIFGRVFAPRDAADPERMPGFVGALGPDGPIGYTTDVRITETNDAAGRPAAISVRARGSALDLDLRFDTASAETTRMTQGPLARGVTFLQLQGVYTVTGSVGGRTVEFRAPGAAETFRGQ
ncbi:hypothetical protein BH24ACI4_BH24ACI4_18520 [soil metagenome]